MKKGFMVVAVLAMVVMAIPAMADYKDSVRNDVMKELGAFFQRNEGSKLTIDLIDGLALHMMQIFEANKIKENVPETPKVPNVPDMPKRPEMPKSVTP